MQQFASPEHLITLGIIATAMTCLCGAARRWPGGWTTWARRALAVTLVVNELGWEAVTLAGGTWSAGSSLPLNLCDLACFVGAAALWTQDRRLAEVTWFWALGGCLQALLTPDTGSSHFPNYGFLQYYIAHAAIVVAALFLVAGLRVKPAAGAVRRVLMATLAAAAVAAAGDAIFGGNYMFLVSRPDAGSLLDMLGPWPFYIGIAAAVAVLLFTILDLPFRLARRAALDPAGD